MLLDQLVAVEPVTLQSNQEEEVGGDDRTSPHGSHSWRGIHKP